MIVVRAVHFAATLLAAGTALFIAAVAQPALRKDDDAVPVVARIHSRLALLAWISLALAVISGAAWLVFVAASMSGRSAAEAIADGVVWTVLAQTTFGRDWLVRAALAGLLVIALARLAAARAEMPVWWKSTVALVAGGLAATLAWAGHAVGGLGVEGILHPAADVLHLIAAAAWAGALVPLAIVLTAVGRDRRSLAVARAATLRFSAIGVASVGTIIATGIINTWYLAGSVEVLTATTYGRLLLVKIGLFLVMVAVAAINKLRLTPPLVQEPDDAIAGDALRQLRRNCLIEAVLGALIIVIVAVLGILPPGLHGEMHSHSH